MKTYQQLILDHNLTVAQKDNIDFDTEHDGIASESAHRISDHVFGADQHTKVIPLESRAATSQIKPPSVVSSHLASKGYSVHDYVGGLASHPEKNQPVRIGKLLNDNPDAAHAFKNDKARESAVNEHKGLQVVISRHPHQVGGMSSGYSFRSCLTLPGGADGKEGGCNAGYISNEIKAGTHVAYLTKKGDDEATQPLARIAMRPFVHKDSGHTVLVPEDRHYGASSDAFGHTVNKFTKTHFPIDGNKLYKMHDSVYSGDSPKHFIGNVANMSHDDIDHTLRRGSPDEKQYMFAHAKTHITPDHIMQGMRDGSSEVRFVASLHPNHNEETLNYALEHGNDTSGGYGNRDFMVSNAIQHPKITAKMIDTAFSKGKVTNIGYLHQHKPHFTDDHLAVLAKHADRYSNDHINDILDHENVGEKTIDAVLNNKNSHWDTKEKAIKHHKATEKNMMTAYADDDSSVQHAAVDHPNATKAFLTHVYDDNEPNNRQLVYHAGDRLDAGDHK